MGPAPASFSLTNQRQVHQRAFLTVNPSEFGESVTFTATVSNAVGLRLREPCIQNGVTDPAPGELVSAPGNTCTAQLAISTLGVAITTFQRITAETEISMAARSMSRTQVVKTVTTLSINDSSN